MCGGVGPAFVQRETHLGLEPTEKAKMMKPLSQTPEAEEGQSCQLWNAHLILILQVDASRSLGAKVSQGVKTRYQNSEKEISQRQKEGQEQKERETKKYKCKMLLLFGCDFYKTGPDSESTCH